MRVIVCGGRDYDDRRMLFDTLDNLHAQLKFDAVIQGGARGADRLAWLWTIARDIECISFPARWEDGRRAGPSRNQEMIDKGQAEMVIAFPGRKGTADMKRRARKAGLLVLEVERVS